MIGIISGTQFNKKKKRESLENNDFHSLFFFKKRITCNITKLSIF